MKKSANELSDRKGLILRTVVESYIENGEPVGSKYLCECGKFTCSSATLRNEMADLEALGYLEQPHTSAGRIPTESGYRFYVNSLMESYNSTAGDVEKIKSALKEKRAELDSILSQASRLASTLTNYTGLALRPSDVPGMFARYETVFLSKRSLLLIMISAGGDARTANMRTDYDVSEAEVKRLADILNRFVSGHSINEVTLPVIMKMEDEMGAATGLVTQAVKCIYDTVSNRSAGDVRFDGMNNLLDYPEYSDTESIAGIMELGDKKDDLLGLVQRVEDNSDFGDEDVKILIGSENHLDALGSSALVYKTVKRDGKVVGAVGVIGPRRMKYKDVISMVDSLAKGINELISVDALPPGSDTTPMAIEDGKDKTES